VAYRILYTEDALEDLQAVLDYIVFDNPQAAERFGTALLNHVDLLRSFPRLGAPVPKRPGVRKMLHNPIRIYYRVHEPKRQIEILHFWHGARSLPSALR
jgi:plasmid stabilization system protein ParE